MKIHLECMSRKKPYDDEELYKFELEEIKIDLKKLS
jgi:hypothetical protein